MTDTRPWRPVEIEKIQWELGAFTEWFLCGGRSLDWLLGRRTRSHGDTDVGVRRGALPACLREIGPERVFLCTGGGWIRPWDGGAVPASVHDIWVTSRAGDAWILQVMVYDDDGDTIVYRRDRRVRWSSEAHTVRWRGIDVLNPLVTMLYKSGRKQMEDKDAADLRTIIESGRALFLPSATPGRDVGGVEARRRAAMRLITGRLVLVPATTALIRAELAGPAELGALLGAHVPDDWPHEALRAVLSNMAALLTDPRMIGWQAWYWLASSEAGRCELAGSGGFKGTPERGIVEIGYGTATTHRRRGYATEAARALIQWAFGHQEVSTILAQVDPANVASLGVLAACGFRECGQGGDCGGDGADGFQGGATPVGVPGGARRPDLQLHALGRPACH